MALGAIGNAMGSMGPQKLQPLAGAAGAQDVRKDPRFAALAAQVGEEMAIQILTGKISGTAGTTGAKNLNAMLTPEDPRTQMAAMMQQARA